MNSKSCVPCYFQHLIAIPSFSSQKCRTLPIRLMACPSPDNIDVVYKFSQQQKKLLASTSTLNTFQKSQVIYASVCQSMKLRVDLNMCEAGRGVMSPIQFMLQRFPKRKIILHGEAFLLFMSEYCKGFLDQRCDAFTRIQCCRVSLNIACAIYRTFNSARYFTRIYLNNVVMY